MPFMKTAITIFSILMALLILISINQGLLAILFVMSTSMILILMQAWLILTDDSDDAQLWNDYVDMPD